MMRPWSTTTSFRQWWINLRRRPKPPPLSIVPVCLAFVTSFLILLNMSFTFENIFHPHKSFTTSSSSSPSLFHVESPFFVINQKHQIPDDDSSSVIFSDENGPPYDEILAFHHGDNFDDSKNRLTDDQDNTNSILNNNNNININNNNNTVIAHQDFAPHRELTSPTKESSVSKQSKEEYEDEVYHDKEIFLENYKEMKRNLKVYIYPHKSNEPFAHALLPTKYEPSGNYASEAYFKNVLFKSKFVTKDASEADFFFLPFSIASLRLDRGIGVGGLPDYILQYMNNISQNYPYWNQSGGADHFYAACHSIGKIALDKVEYVKSNAIQVVCSSSYFLRNYFAHKDVSLPQIWPRHEELPDLASVSKRKKLAFFAGAANSPLRKSLVETWQNDTSIFAHGGRLNTPYSEQLLRSKYCLHVKGYEVNTARVGDAIYYGCVPVILADHYDLPFMDILNWESFSVVITNTDIPNLKKILQSISFDRYKVMQANVLKIRKHFQWNKTPHDYDTFYMVMYELWLRRSSIRIKA